MDPVGQIRIVGQMIRIQVDQYPDPMDQYPQYCIHVKTQTQNVSKVLRRKRARKKLKKEEREEQRQEEGKKKETKGKKKDKKK